MKPANFPARKNARRVSAIARFEAAAKAEPNPLRMSRDECIACANAAALSISGDRSTRTKKDRREFARMSR